MSFAKEDNRSLLINFIQFTTSSNQARTKKRLVSQVNNAVAQMKKDWQKVLSCCQRAAQDGWVWILIETCCIDKTSGAELSQAVNPMFAWYERAVICYAYLEDAKVQPHGPQVHLSLVRRGHTLQELIALVLFSLPEPYLDKSWNSRLFGYGDISSHYNLLV